MKKIHFQNLLIAILLLLTIASGIVFGENKFLDIDYDKWLHFTVSFSLSTSITQFEKKWEWNDKYHLFPISTVIITNLGKEIYDSNSGGSFDLRDISSGVVGGLFGVALTHLWEKNNEQCNTQTANPTLTSTILSIVIPGGGHFYNGQIHKGWIYLGLESATLFPVIAWEKENKSALWYIGVGAFTITKIIEVADISLSYETTKTSSLLFSFDPIGNRIICSIKY